MLVRIQFFFIRGDVEEMRKKDCVFEFSSRVWDYGNSVPGILDNGNGVGGR